jgi:hypothetical protein
LTVLNAGVEKLYKLPDNDGGWLLGMDHMDHKSQAMAMNSQHTRTENQVHIHICPKVSDAESVLAGLNKASYTSLKHVPHSGNWSPKDVKMYCEVSKTPSSSVAVWLNNLPKGVDNTQVGIGMLSDSHGDWWSCASVGGVPEHGVFCV